MQIAARDLPLRIFFEELHDLFGGHAAGEREDNEIFACFVFHLDADDAGTTAGQLQFQNGEEIPDRLRRLAELVTQIIFEFPQRRFILAARKLLVHRDTLLLIRDVATGQHRLHEAPDLGGDLLFHLALLTRLELFHGALEHAR